MKTDPLVSELAKQPAPIRTYLPTFTPPNLSATQLKVYHDDLSKFILVTGGRGSGKTFICLCKCIKHAWENNNALVIVVTNSKGQAEQGCWSELLNLMASFSEEYGIQYQEKTNKGDDSIIIIRNRHGGMSQIALFSASHGIDLQKRFKQRMPSLIYVEELTDFEDSKYFSVLMQQIGRRTGFDKTVVQQYIASCNPKGPSHWVYKIWFVKNVRNLKYKVYHIPVDENKDNMDPEYWKDILSALEDDVAKARALEGKWIDTADSDAVFAEDFLRPVHIIGSGYDIVRPNPDHPVYISWDPGSVNSAVVFLQRAYAKSGEDVWCAFDAFAYDGEPNSYQDVTLRVLERLDYWEELVGAKLMVTHVADDQIFNQYNAFGGGGYAVDDIISSSMGRITHIIPGPKANNSKAARVMEVRKLLRQNRLFVSHNVEPVVSMFLNLKCDTKNGIINKNSFKKELNTHAHVFDAMSYALLYVAQENHFDAKYKHNSDTMRVKSFLR